MLTKELPESSWGEFLMDFSKSNEGKAVKVSAQFKEGSIRTLGQNKLITFEGDCTGDVWERVKVAIGDMEGGSPDALFHTVTFPKSFFRVLATAIAAPQLAGPIML